MTIKEIASVAGFSHATVSSVLNGRAAERRISPRAVARVEAAAHTLGYIPNIAARRLRAHAIGTSQAVLAVITSFETPLPLVSRAARALQRLIPEGPAGCTQFTISIEMFHAGHLRDLPGILSNDRFSGALIANTIEADDRFLAEAILPFPVVLIGRRVPGYTSVIESAETGRAAARLLQRSGCRRCAVLFPAMATPTSQHRVDEFISVIAGMGLPPVVPLGCGDRGEKAGYLAMQAHLGRPDAADGFFAVNDTLATGAYHAVREAGRSIPEDLCFVGVGDSDTSPYLAPPLTCVGSSEDDLHNEAARLLMRRFTGRQAEPVSVQLSLQTHIRESTRINLPA